MSGVSIAAIKLAKYKFYLVGMQEIISDKGGTEPADSYIFFYGNGMIIIT
jgi:hypothetical protein